MASGKASSRGSRGAAGGRRSAPSGGVERTRALRSRRPPVGYAVIGLGHIAQVAVLPAFAHAKNARLVALVSGAEEKREELGKRYHARGYSYDQLDQCLASEDVDAVYIAVPNHRHAEIVAQCARAGVHVLCEKPLAVTEQECWEMIRACEDASVKLMVAYRLHFQSGNLEAIRIARSGKLGELRFFSSDFSYQLSGGNVRSAPQHQGGGPAFDIGVYCINAARNLFRDEPEQVFAVAARGPEIDPRFRETPAGLSAILKFPGERLATFTVQYDAAPTGAYRIAGTRGDLRVSNAYEYKGQLTHDLTIGARKKRHRFPAGDQFGPELVEFSRCIQEGREPEPDGEEGLADVRVIQALLRSANTGRAVELPPLRRRKRPDASQAMHRPPVREPELFEAKPPTLN